MMNMAAIASNASIRMVLITLAIAPPNPKCDSSAPNPRPSKAPPSMPRHGLAGLGGTDCGFCVGAAAGVFGRAACDD